MEHAEASAVTSQKRAQASTPEISEQEIRPSDSSKRPKNDASARHIKTEQARRDKIAAGFSALSDLLPGKEKVEKALLLTQAAEYISQLQSVLQVLMTSGAISKLPDDLQWQIRTLLPRKDGKPVAAAPAPAEPAASQLAPTVLAGGLPLPLLPLVAPAPVHTPEVTLNKELPQDESALLAQVQALLQQQQQQAVATQQIQNWQQTLQALQLQQVLQQQQQGHVLPDLLSQLGNTFGTASNPLTSLPLFPGSQSLGGLTGLQSALLAPQPSEQPAPAAPPKHAGGCFVDELPKCGLQQLVDAAACEPSSTSCRLPHKARKNVKVRRHTTAARIPKPDSQGPAPARMGAGRPEPV